jgi:hypothetical protein
MSTILYLLTLVYPCPEFKNLFAEKFYQREIARNKIEKDLPRSLPTILFQYHRSPPDVQQHLLCLLRSWQIIPSRYYFKVLDELVFVKENAEYDSELINCIPTDYFLEYIETKKMKEFRNDITFTIEDHASRVYVIYEQPENFRRKKTEQDMNEHFQQGDNESYVILNAKEHTIYTLRYRVNNSRESWKK